MFPPSRQARDYRGPLLALTLILLCVGLALPCFGQAIAASRSFALAAGVAEVTLETFSEQADVSIVYPLDDVLGVPTNAEYLARVMSHSAFMAGRLHTGFVVEHADALSGSPATAQERVAAVIAAALEDVDFRRTAFGVPEPYASMGDWRN